MINEVNFNKVSTTNTAPQQNLNNTNKKLNSFSTVLSEIDLAKTKSVEPTTINKISSSYQELPTSVTAQFYKIFGDPTQTF